MPRWPVSVKGVLIWDGRVLLVHNERDEWELPGGGLEIGESPEECVVREVKEEVLLDATAVQLLDVWPYEVLPNEHVLIVTFGCEAQRPGELLHSDEHDDVALVPMAELSSLRLPAGYRNSIAAWARRLDGTEPGVRGSE
jgi:8-oxo-dGTP pyrophosphatase MutT (NUDIX family)